MDMNPRIAPDDREPADPTPAPTHAGAPGPDPATSDAGASADRAASTLVERLSSALAHAIDGAKERISHLVAGDGAAHERHQTPEEAAAYEEALRQAFRAAAPVVPARPVPRRGAEPEAAEPGPAAESTAADATGSLEAARTTPPEAAMAPEAAPTPEASVVGLEGGLSDLAASGTPDGLEASTSEAEPLSPGAIEATETAIETEAMEVDAAALAAGGLDAAALAADLAEPVPGDDAAEPPAGPLAAVGPAAATHSSAPISFPPVGNQPGGPPPGPAPRAAGETASEELLEVPESVGTAADDFFGGLVRRVERRP
jgi:hypothetical protein